MLGFALILLALFSISSPSCGYRTSLLHKRSYMITIPLKVVTPCSSGEFNQLVINSDKPVLVDFFATWCGPCKLMNPILEQLSEELIDKVRIVKVDADQNEELVEQFDVQGLPTFALFYEGKLISTSAGAVPKDRLKGFISSELSKRNIVI